MATLDEAQELVGFATKAATDFTEHPDHMTYSAGCLEAGDLLALRWGPDGDCVKVVKLDEHFTPVQYDEACWDGLDAGKLLQLVLAMQAVPSHEKEAWAQALAALGRFTEPYRRKVVGHGR